MSNTLASQTSNNNSKVAELAMKPCMTPMAHIKSTNPALSKWFVKWIGRAAVVAGVLVTQNSQAELTVYTAQQIRTLEPALPQATAVAVEDGLIVAVGSLESLAPVIALKGGTIDRRFEEHVILPGFIDPHVHPSLPAVLTQFPFLAPDDWQLPTGYFPGAKTPKEYKTKLIAQAKAHTENSVPFISWGYHPLWHGEIWREDLNAWFGEQPVVLWHRSFHEIIANDAALAMLNITEADAQAVHDANWIRGHFYETGLKAIVGKLGFLFAPQRFGKGMANFMAMIHQAGVTTVLDMGTGLFGDPTQEIAAIRAVAETFPVPTRIILTPIIVDFMARGVKPMDAIEEVRRWQATDSPRVQVGNHFKLMLDGAIFSGLSQFNPPGYLDGHEGVWMAPRDITHDYARAFWDAGFQLHAHSNGDAATDWFLDLLQTLLDEAPRADHRMTLEHFAYSTEDQTRRLKTLGAVVSANPYYHYILSDMYSEAWLGPDRGAQMNRLGSIERASIPLALHSDNPMAPLSPLTLMWSAVARETINGRAGIASERLSREQALRAVTIDAAFIAGLENQLGSIRAGKRADFTVLADDPLGVSINELPNIKVVATVFAGTPYPVTHY